VVPKEALGKKLQEHSNKVSEVIANTKEQLAAIHEEVGEINVT
jgi:hypothetical protein